MWLYTVVNVKTVGNVCLLNVKLTVFRVLLYLIAINTSYLLKSVNCEIEMNVLVPVMFWHIQSHMNSHLT